MVDETLNKALPLAHHLADLARPVARDVWLAPRALDLKDDGSHVTRADLEIETRWRQEIQHRFPDHGIWGEEHGTQALGSTYVWVLDPIDGTRQFGLGLTDFSSMISLCRDGKPVLGIVDLPLCGLRYTALAGQGAYLEDRKLSTSAQRVLTGMYAGLANQDSFPEAHTRAYEIFRKQAHSSVFDGGSPAYGALAAGKLDLCINGTDLETFDICALVVLVTEAGGCISGWDGSALRLGCSGAIVATSNAELHEQALAVTSRCLG